MKITARSTEKIKDDHGRDRQFRLDLRSFVCVGFGLARQGGPVFSLAAAG